MGVASWEPGLLFSGRAEGGAVPLPQGPCGRGVTLLSPFLPVPHCPGAKCRRREGGSFLGARARADCVQAAATWLCPLPVARLVRLSLRWGGKPQVGSPLNPRGHTLVLGMPVGWPVPHSQNEVGLWPGPPFPQTSLQCRTPFRWGQRPSSSSAPGAPSGSCALTPSGGCPGKGLGTPWSN